MLPIRLISALAVLATAACAAPPRTAQPSAQAVSTLESLREHPCTPMIASALAGQEVDPSAVTSLTVTERRLYTEALDDLLGYLAWMRLEGQPGYLLVSLDEFCRVRQVYTRGGTEVPGVPSYS